MELGPFLGKIAQAHLSGAGTFGVQHPWLPTPRLISLCLGSPIPQAGLERLPKLHL